MNLLKWFRRKRAERESAPKAPEPQAGSAKAEQAKPAPPAEAEQAKLALPAEAEAEQAKSSPPAEVKAKPAPPAEAVPAPPAEVKLALSAEEAALAQELRGAADFLAERIDADVPSTGRGRPVFIRMPIAGTRNSALLIVHPGAKDRTVTLGAMREGYDMQVMNCVFSGGNDEVKAWLRRPETPGELAALVMPLSDSLDEKLN